MRRKAAALLLALTLCGGFATQNVNAASCPPHDYQITGIKGGFTEDESRHKVYRNLYVDGQQIYSWCIVTYKKTIYNTRCMKCGDVQEMPQTTASHSLAGDPDHT